MRFLVTEESRRVARWLRLCGYDAAQAPATPLDALYRRAYNEGRVVVTRDRKVKSGCLIRVVHLEGQDVVGQLRQLRRDVRLTIDQTSAFTRCDRCNVAVEPMEKSSVEGRVPPYVFQTQRAFHACPSCHRVYWAATHWQRACRLFEQVQQAARHA